MKKLLPALRDTSRVDCFNELSAQYIRLEKKDSAKYFAGEGLEEAKRVSYAHGIAISFCRESQIAKHFDDNLVLAESLAKESLSWFDKTPNQDGVYDVYHELMFSIFGQSRFDESIIYALKKLEWGKEHNDDDKVVDALSNIGAIYKDAGNYERSLYYAQQAKEFAITKNNPYWLQGTLFGLGELFMKIEDYPSALRNFRQAFQMDNPQLEKRRIDGDFDIWMKMEFAEIFSHLGEFDSAWYYFQLYKPASTEDRYFRIYLVSTGEYYFLQKKYQQALRNFLQGLALHKKLSDRNEIQRSLIFIAETYLALKQYDSAMEYSREALNVANITKAQQVFRDAYGVLYAVYDEKNMPDSANIYFRKYSIVKDSVADAEVRAKLAVSNYELRIQLLDKEKELQQQKLDQTAQQKNYLLAIIASIIIIGIFIFRSVASKRRSEKQLLQHDLELQKKEGERAKSEMQQEMTKLELKALRAQMNPHFIFNCLNSINRFIITNDAARAADHLTKFAKLIRIVLQQSGKSFIPLEDELFCLQLYMDLEALRFELPFSYGINCNGVDVSSIMIPTLLIQPFVENAIWHGLRGNNNAGKIHIDFHLQNEVLHCEVRDNGIGRYAAKQVKGAKNIEKESMGIQITQQRLQLIDNSEQTQPGVTVEDLVDETGASAGTCVLIRIPVKKN